MLRAGDSSVQAHKASKGQSGDCRLICLAVGLSSHLLSLVSRTACSPRDSLDDTCSLLFSSPPPDVPASLGAWEFVSWPRHSLWWREALRTPNGARGRGAFPKRRLAKESRAGRVWARCSKCCRRFLQPSSFLHVHHHCLFSASF